MEYELDRGVMGLSLIRPCVRSVRGVWVALRSFFYAGAQ